MKKFLFIVLIILGGVIVAVSLSKPNSTATNSPSQPKRKIQDRDQVNKPFTEISAGFAIYTNGTFRTFTASMYHNLSEDVFIEANNPNIVVVKKEGVTWKDFFSTLPLKLTSECLTTGTGQTFCTNETAKLKFFLNGQEDGSALSKQINQADKLLISYGSEELENLDYQFAQIP